MCLASVKSRLVLPFWYRLTWVVPEKGPLNRCVCVFSMRLIYQHQDDGDDESAVVDASVNMAGNQKRRSTGACSSIQASPSETKKSCTMHTQLMPNLSMGNRV